MAKKVKTLQQKLEEAGEFQYFCISRGIEKLEAQDYEYVPQAIGTEILADGVRVICSMEDFDAILVTTEELSMSQKNWEKHLSELALNIAKIRATEDVLEAETLQMGI